MMAFFAQYSFLIVSSALGFGLGLVLWRWQRRSAWLRAGLFAWYLFGVLLVGLIWRYPAAEAATPAEVEAILANGQPSFVMLYSNFCLGCMAALGQVQDAVPALRAAGLNVLLLDVNDEPGRALRDRFAFISTPTYLLYDAAGAEIRRLTRLPDLAELLRAAT